MTDMNKPILGFFMGLGIVDLAYGLWVGDKISVMIGVVIVVITASIMQKNKEEGKGNQKKKNK